MSVLVPYDATQLVFIPFADVPIGFAQIKNINHIGRSCEVGFCIGPKYQGRGYGTKLIKELVNYASV
ncbi:MAG: GNAT family N-acetyltransferase, partial [Desulfobacteraceae bacterium]|nr:GNAT family N-acetyltransferase [Desulfobacteraceae bacterium]